MYDNYLVLKMLKQAQMSGLTSVSSLDECDEYARSMSRKVTMSGGVNTTWFNAADSRDDGQSRFLVLTSGNCGAIWFASALNLHHDVFAGCGIDHPIESCLFYNLQKDGDALVAASKADNYRCGWRSVRHIQDSSPLLELAFKRHNLNYPLPDRDVASLAWYVFDEIEGLPGNAAKKALGSVHAFSATEFAGYFQKDSDILRSRKVITANMIRHPLTRIESFMKAFEFYGVIDQYKDLIDDYIKNNLDEMLTIERCFKISLNEPRSRSMIYVYYIGHTVQWVADELQKFKQMKAFKMELLQSDPDYFANALHFLTSGRVAADDSYLDAVFKPENLGVGRRGNIPDGTRPPSPREQWRLWSDWERYEFKRCCLLENIPAAYAAYDYDFSFIG